MSYNFSIQILSTYARVRKMTRFPTILDKSVSKALTLKQLKLLPQFNSHELVYATIALREYKNEKEGKVKSVPVVVFLYLC